MKIDVPYVFQIAFVPKGLRNPKHVPAHASTPVEVAETPGTLAFEIGCPYAERNVMGKVENVSPFHAPRGETVRVYRAEDAYWVEICAAEEAQRNISARHAMLKDPFDVILRLSERNWADSGSRIPADKEFRSRAELEREHTALRSWDESARDRTAAVLQRRAAEDLRIIDGRLCMRVSEPVLDVVWHSTPKPPPPPKPKSHGRSRRGWRSYEREPELPPAPPPQGDGPADGFHLVVTELTDRTPAGFHPVWSLRARGGHRFRIDQTEAAVAFIRADEARRLAAENAARAAEEEPPLLPDPSKRLHDPELTVAFADTSTCKHEGLSAILEREIDHLRECLIENAGALDKEMLTAALDLQHAFERDGGRPTPDLIAKARAVADLHESGHGTIDLPPDVAHTVGLRSSSLYGDLSAGALPGRVDGFRFALAFWDRRDQAACEWTDRLLPVPVTPGTDFDVVELATLQRGQDLVDMGCDPAVLEAVARVPHGDLHVVAAETLDRKLLGFAAAIRGSGADLTIERVFSPSAPNPRTLEQMKARFESFVTANLDATAENDALMGMTL